MSIEYNSRRKYPGNRPEGTPERGPETRYEPGKTFVELFVQSPLDPAQVGNLADVQRKLGSHVP